MNPEAYSKLVPIHYDKHEPPATDVAPAIVYFDMKLLDITSINENEMVRNYSFQKKRSFLFQSLFIVIDGKLIGCLKYR